MRQITRVSLQAAYGGYGELCTTCSSVGMINLSDMYIPDDYYTYDLDKAKAAFSDAGIADGTSFYDHGKERRRSNHDLCRDSYSNRCRAWV